MYAWAAARFGLATVLSCVAVIVLFVVWVDVGTARSDSVDVLLSFGTLIAMVLSIAGIFFTLVYRRYPHRRGARSWTIARSCLATLFSCLAGIVLFYVWFGVGFDSDMGLGMGLAFSGVVLTAIVLSVVGIFSALVFRPKRHQPSAALRVGTGGWAPDPSGRYEWRYFDGASWTEHVATAGCPEEDPLRQS